MTLADLILLFDSSLMTVRPEDRVTIPGALWLAWVREARKEMRERGAA